MKITTIGLDLTKSVFHMVCFDAKQQKVQALHRLRQQRIKERTALCNPLRALVAEYAAQPYLAI